MHTTFFVTDEDWKRPIAYTLSFCIYVWSITVLYDLLCELFLRLSKRSMKIEIEIFPIDHPVNRSWLSVFVETLMRAGNKKEQTITRNTKLLVFAL